MAPVQKINPDNIFKAFFDLGLLNVEYTESFIEDWNELEKAVDHFKFINRFIFPARI